MAMGSFGGAVSAASSFLGLGALRMRAEAASAYDEPSDAPAVAAPVSTRTGLGVLEPGDPCFEAVAQALADAGYLDS